MTDNFVETGWAYYLALAMIDCAAEHNIRGMVVSYSNRGGDVADNVTHAIVYQRYVNGQLIETLDEVLSKQVAQQIAAADLVIRQRIVSELDVEHSPQIVDQLLRSRKQYRADTCIEYDPQFTMLGDFAVFAGYGIDYRLPMLPLLTGLQRMQLRSAINARRQKIAQTLISSRHLVSNPLSVISLINHKR